MNFKDYLPFLLEGVYGTYAGVHFDEMTIRDLMFMQDLLSIPNRLPPEKFHSTLLYSRKPLPNYVAFGPYPVSPTSDTNEFELKVFETQGGKRALVLAYKCTFLEERHKSLMEEHDGTWDHPSFIPHITLSYDIGDTDIKLGPIQFISERKIVILDEYGSDLDPSWSKQ
jgi:hypothetical protein